MSHLFNTIKNAVSPPKMKTPEGNRDLGKGPIVMPKLSASEIREGLLAQNLHSANEQTHIWKKGVAPQQQTNPSRSIN